jgi:hypothetical protein
MPYDLAIVNTKGAPCRQVSINVDDHSRLIAIAKDLGLPLLQRMSDYYADAEFLVTEMEGLQAEWMRVSQCMNVTNRVVPSWVSEAIALVAEAKAKKSGIVGIAD